jgi:DNA-binding transcriptional LysR family regulator
MPQLPAFLARYPHLRIELNSTDRHVDLIAEGLDCVVRTGNLVDSGLIVRPLGQLHSKNYASPSYLAHYGTPTTLQDLKHHWLVQYNIGNANQYNAFVYYNGTQYARVPMQSKISVNNVDAYRAACVAGLGIIQAPQLGASPLIEQGLIVEILPEYYSQPLPVSILYPHKRNLSKRVRVFIDWLANIIQPHTL